MGKLRRGDIEEFCLSNLIEFEDKFYINSIMSAGVDMADMVRRRKYFSSRRLKSVVNSLDNIEVIKEDIFDFMGGFSCGVDKVYFSNSLDNFDRGSSFFESDKLKFLNMYNGLSKGGLLYLSRGLKHKFNFLSGLVKDEDQSNVAWRIERKSNVGWSWKPEVYRKIR